jgi:hypothetical protein
VAHDLKSAERHPPQSAENWDQPDPQGSQHARQPSRDPLEANLLRADVNRDRQRPSIFEAFDGSRDEIRQTELFKSTLNLQDTCQKFRQRELNQ